MTKTKYLPDTIYQTPNTRPDKKKTPDKKLGKREKQIQILGGNLNLKFENYDRYTAATFTNVVLHVSPSILVVET